MKSCLKRSSSAPLINQLVAAEEAAAECSKDLRTDQSRSSHRPDRVQTYVPAPAASRWRRWSTSTSLSPVSPGSPISSQVTIINHGQSHCHDGQYNHSLSLFSSQGAGWARLNRLRVEETGDVVVREIQTERDVHRGLSIENNLSQSWEDLSLVRMLMVQ